MKKHFSMIFCIALLISPFIYAQNTDRNASVIDATQNVATANNLNLRAFKPRALTEDKTDQFEIRGLGGITFTAANISDGTANSYKHSLQINVTLIPVKDGNNNFHLVFYSQAENIQEAATYNMYNKEGTLMIYYPVSMYQGIKEKLEESLAARKKVYIKVIQKINGYREGSLVF